MCHRVQGLSPTQAKLCQLYFDHMPSVSIGAQLGIIECRNQFQFRRWNCSSHDSESAFGPVIQKGKIRSSFLHLVLHLVFIFTFVIFFLMIFSDNLLFSCSSKFAFSTATKEAAFAHSVSAAGVVHSISRSCKQARLRTCSCSQALRPKELHRDWIWGGCGDNLEYAYRFAEGFIDVREKEKNYPRYSKGLARMLMNLHNNEAGRRVGPLILLSSTNNTRFF